MDHVEQAVKLFMEGYSCSQAVAMAFCDVTGLDERPPPGWRLPLAAAWGGCGRSAALSAVCC